MEQEGFGSFVLFGAPQLRHDLAITGECAFQIASALLELSLEARNVEARKRRAALRILLEGGASHVGLPLVGVNDSQFEVISVAAEVRFQFEHFAVGGDGFVIAAWMKRMSPRVSIGLGSPGRTAM